jgi:hypothetical protein
MDYNTHEGAMMILDTCATIDPLVRFPLDAIAEGLVNKDKQIFWGRQNESLSNTTSETVIFQPLVTAPGGEYRLCWCAAAHSFETGANGTTIFSSRGEYACSTAEHFRVDIGTLHLIAPNPLVQHRTCVSGQTCVIDGFKGHLSSSTDRIQILDTCGITDALILRVVEDGFFGPTSLSSTAQMLSQAVWGSVPITAKGGQYRLCWCHKDSKYPCDLAEHFDFDMGELTLIGVTPLYQDRTCISGQTCAFDGITGHFMSSFTTEGEGGRIMVLDTCGTQAAYMHPPRWPGAGVMYTPNVNISDLTTSGVSVTWGTMVVTSAGGQYRLCWCAAGYICSVTEHFRVDMGRIELIGPSLHHARTCVSGQRCLFDGLLGYGVSDNDRLVVLDTCAFDLVQPRWVNSGSLLVVEDEGGTVSFGSTFLTAQGGEYRICWCAAAYACSVVEHFRVDMGGLLIIGPSPLHQDRTCVSGQHCYSHTIDGVGMQPFKLVDVTGFRFKQDGNNDNDIASYYLQVSYDYASNPLTATWLTVGGSLCSATAGTTDWQYCTGWDPPVSAPHWRWWITSKYGSASDPPRPREVGFFGRTMTDYTGWVLDQHPGWVVASAGYAHEHGGIVYDASKLMDGDWSDSSRWWPMGITADWTVVFDLGGASDSIMVLDTCRTTEVLPRSATDGFLQQAISSVDFISWGSTHVTAQGGQYRLCWCSRGFACTHGEEFRVDFGRLTLIGPAPLTQDRTCVSGEMCGFKEVLGHMLTAEDKYLVLDTCGTSVDVLPRWPDAGYVVQMHHSGARVTWGSMIITSQGGEYRLCWCAGSSSEANVTQYASEHTGGQPMHPPGDVKKEHKYPCTTYSDFRVDVGRLALVGPAPLKQDRTCVSGQTCRFDGLIGWGIGGGTDRLMILDSCGASATPGRRFANAALISSTSSGATVTWGTTYVTAAGGEYRLCWCAGASACSVHENFRVDLGELTLVGPRHPNDLQLQGDRQQLPDFLEDRTCVSGQTCAFEMIRGHLLSQNDRFLVIDTCGVASSIPRILAAGRPATVSLPCGCPLGEADEDGDGVKNCQDGCPNDANKLEPEVCGCGAVDSDSDGDGVFDCVDSCPSDPAKSLDSGQCGCGNPETDSDSDGTPNCIDLCPSDASKIRAGICPGPQWLELPAAATQSSTHQDGVALRAIDGKKNTDFFQDGCAHTGLEANPWWSISLSHVYDVETVRVTNRGDCCGERLNNLSIWVTNSSSSYGTGIQCATGVVIPEGETRDINCVAQGSMVWLAIIGRTEYLTLCEVEIKAAPAIIQKKWSGGTHYEVGSECLLAGLGTACGCGESDTDSDGDGTADCMDQCPSDPYKVDVGECGCGEIDDDSDGDGTPDCIDQCPDDAAKTRSGICGCGVSEADGDGDGTPDCNDNCPGIDKTCPSTCAFITALDSDGDGTDDCVDECPYDPTRTAKGDCGCAVYDLDGSPPARNTGTTGLTEVDSDADGTADCVDQCPNDVSKTRVGQCGCGLADTDTDGDGTADCKDQCPSDPNKDRIGVCGCGVLDVDSDNDGTPDCLDQCPDDFNATKIGICGCDALDSDNDGSPDCVDQCPLDVYKTAAGACGCGVSDVDSDGDGSPDCHDTCSGISDKVFTGLSISFGTGSITATGGEYRLCWCAAAFSCSVEEDYRFDVGEVTLVGPRPLMQDRTCVSGHTCFLDGIVGHLISEQDTVMLMDTCGLRTLIPGLPNGGVLGGLTSDIAVSTQSSIAGAPTSTVFSGDDRSLHLFGLRMGFGSVHVTAEGGQYRMCWCGAGYFCEVAEAAIVDMGRFTVIGPVPLFQERTCVSGQTCQLDGILGHHFQNGDEIFVLDTCGFHGHPPRFPGAGQLTLTTATGATVNFGSTPVSAQGGRYRLCWCAAGLACSLFEQIRLDLGLLRIVGPAPLTQDRTCVSGQVCAFESITGPYTSSQDSFWVLDTCAVDAFASTAILAKASSASLRLPNAGRAEGDMFHRLCGCEAALGDYDDDGVLNCLDACPWDGNKTELGTCGCNALDVDLDGDAVFDCVDYCPQDPLKTIAAQCGCGFADVDSDYDGVLDCDEQCPNDENKTAPGFCGCSTPDIDSDGDGVPDCYDECPGIADPHASGATCNIACAGGFNDTDGDGVVNCIDACPRDPDKSSVGVCGCGVPETDTDNDGTPDCNDQCPNDALKTKRGFCGCGVSDLDSDDDGVPDCQDACPNNFNKTTFGYCGCDHQDTDLDLDGTPDCYDLCPGVFDKTPDPAEDMTFTFGSVATTAQGGQYRLCWCSGQQTCSISENFRTDAGRFTIIGPRPLFQDRTCVSGQTCSFGSIDGHHLAIDDQLMILDTCSIELITPDNDTLITHTLPRWALVGHIARMSSSGGRVDWSVPVTSQGGQYRLCWCAGSYTCSTLEDFRVDTGRMTLIGPAPLTQDRTCVSGQTCQLDGFVGKHLKVEDRVLILDTCAKDTVLPRITLDGQLVQLAASGSTLAFNSMPLTAAGGLYRLCWCAGWPPETRPNASGLVYSVDSDGDGTADCFDRCPFDDNKTNPGMCGCGVPDADMDADGMPDCRDTCPDDHAKILPGTCGCGLPDTDTDLDFTPDCSDHCPADGQKIVPGKCGCDESEADSDTDGTPDCLDVCSFDSLKQAPGECGCGISDTDTDGDGAMDCLDGCPTDFNKTTPGICGCGTPDVDSDGDGVPDCVDSCPGTADRIDMICGCAAGYNDTDDDGTYDCMDECPEDANKNLTGVCGCGVSDTDADADGTPDCIDACPTDHLKVAPGPCGCNASDVDTDGDGTPDCVDQCPLHYEKVSSGFCGCGANETDSDGDGTPDCRDFCETDATKVLPGTCGCNVTDADSDGDGYPDCVDVCPADPSKYQSEGTCGCGVSEVDSDFDGKPDCIHFEHCPGLDALQPAIQRKHICSISENYRVDMGQIVILGPSPLDQDRTCVSGQTCRLDGFVGRELNSGDEVLVLETCAPEAGHRAIPRFVAAGRDWQMEGSGAAVHFGNTPITARGGLYRLCWCAAGHACSVYEDFRVDMGSLLIIGPAPISDQSFGQDRTCVAGQHCEIDGLTGVHLSSSNQFLIVDTCGLSRTMIPRFANTGLVQHMAPGIITSSMVEVMTSGATVSFSSIMVTAEGGQYRLCWCADVNKFPCSVAEGFRVDVGEVRIIGPAPLYQDRTCISGQVCELDSIRGSHLSTSDKFFVLDTCATDTLLPRWYNSGQYVDLVASGAFVSWGGTNFVTAQGGEYRLCWCAAGYTCSLVEHFRVDMGRLMLVGPRPLNQHRTCVSGQTCLFESITGQHLRSDDVFFILDTCGVSTVPHDPGVQPRIPNDGMMITLQMTGATVSWGTVPVTLQGGQYRLCWCANGDVHGDLRQVSKPENNTGYLLPSYVCSTAEHFRVDVGEYTHIGPYPLQQDRTCVSGQVCSFDGVIGHHLHMLDKILIVDTCGE